MTMLLEANVAGSEISRVRVQALWLQSMLTRSMDTKGIYWFCSVIFSWTIQWEKSKPVRHITPRPVALKPSRLSMWHSLAFSPGLYICSSCGKLHEKKITPGLLPKPQNWCKTCISCMFTFVISTVSYKCWGETPSGCTTCWN